MASKITFLRLYQRDAFLKTFFNLHLPFISTPLKSKIFSKIKNT